MIISIHDKSLRRVGFLDNEKPGALHFYDDIWHRYLKEASSTFDLTIPKTGNEYLQYLTEKNFLSFRYNGKDHLFNIMKTDETDDKITIYTENLTLELLNEQAGKYAASSAMSFEDYFNESSLIGGKSVSGLEIGVNEISAYKRKLSWDGEDTKLARLLSLVSEFDAECEFVTELNRDGTLKRILLNLYMSHDDGHQGVGAMTGKTLYYGKEITGARRTIDKTELYSLIYPVGTDGLEISSLEKTVYDSNGKILYSSPSGNPFIYAPQTAEEYPAQVSTNGDKWILLRWSYDTENVNTLYSKALAKLKSVSVPSITYEIEGTYDLEIGDTVTIQDEKFSPTLIIEARVSEQEISFSDERQNKNIYSNFRALESKLSSSITKELSNLVNDATPALIYIHSSEGTAFKNNAVNTVLTITIYHGNKTITDQAGLISEFGIGAYLQWSIRKFGDADFTTVISSDTHLSNNGFTYTVSADDVDKQIVFNVQIITN